MGVSSSISIDIGLKNLAIYKEYFDTDEASKIYIPKLRYNKLGEAHEEFREYINKVSQCGQCVFIDINIGDEFIGQIQIELFDVLSNCSQLLINNNRSFVNYIIYCNYT